MRPDADPLELTPDERLRQLAKLLAGGVLRLLARDGADTHPAAEKPQNSGQNSLEVPVETRLTVQSS